jgi:alkylation response protein AidB-like acyl-CoA dehydrogenase
LQQAANELLCEMGGLRGLRMEPEDNGPEEDPDWLRSLGAAYFYSRSQSIFGGTNEIQRNIIAKASLGLR